MSPVSADKADELVGADASPSLKAESSELFPVDAVEYLLQAEIQRLCRRKAKVDGCQVLGGQKETMENRRERSHAGCHVGRRMEVDL